MASVLTKNARILIKFSMKSFFTPRRPFFGITLTASTNCGEFLKNRNLFLENACFFVSFMLEFYIEATMEE